MEDIKDKDSPDSKGSLYYWKRWIQTAKKARETHLQDAKEAYAEYDNQVCENDAAKKSAPLYWSNTKTLEPSFYAKTPEVRSRRRGNHFDPVSNFACSLTERIGNYFVECSDFDGTMESLVSDFIHADKASIQVKYDAELVPARINLFPNGDSFLTETGELFNGEVLQDEMGYFSLSETELVATNKKVYAIPLPYDNVLHTPEARFPHEITEKAYFFSLTEEEAKKRFPEDKIAQINWKEKKGQKDDKYSSEVEETSPNKIVEGWECWCKPTGKVYWVSDQVEMDFLDVKDDPYKLVNFFPDTKFVIGSKPSQNLYPRNVYSRLKPTIEKCHRVKNRIHELIEQIKRVCLIDGANEELIYALNSASSGEFVAVTNLQTMLEKGGLETAVYWIPVQELVQAISELVELETKFKADISEWFGVPDVLRGGVDPTGNAELAQMNQTAAHDRFKLQKKKIAKAASEIIQLGIEMTLELFTDEEIANIIELQTMPQEEQQYFAPALQMLRNDRARMIAIDIDTDSMTFVNEQLKSEQMNQVAATLTNGFTQISQMAQIDPSIAGVALKALLCTLEAMPLGRKFQESVSSAGNQLLEKLNNPPPPPPPPPDYEMMKLEIKAQEVKVKEFQQQVEAMSKDREIALKEAQLAGTQIKEAQELELKAIRLQLDKTIESFMMQIEASRASMDAWQIQIEEFKARAAALESEREEVRLARDTQMAEIREAREADKELLAAVLENQRIEAEKAKNQPAPVIKLEVPKSRKEVGRLIYDPANPMGDAKIEIEEIDDGIKK